MDKATKPPIEGPAEICIEKVLDFFTLEELIDGRNRFLDGLDEHLLQYASLVNQFEHVEGMLRRGYEESKRSELLFQQQDSLPAVRWAFSPGQKEEGRWRIGGGLTAFVNARLKSLRDRGHLCLNGKAEVLNLLPCSRVAAEEEQSG